VGRGGKKRARSNPRKDSALSSITKNRRGSQIVQAVGRKVGEIRAVRQRHLELGGEGESRGRWQEKKTSVRSPTLRFFQIEKGDRGKGGGNEESLTIDEEASATFDRTRGAAQRIGEKLGKTR